MQKILTGAVIGGLACLLVVWFNSGSESMAVRVTTSLLVVGGGFIAGGLVTMVIVEKDEHSSKPS